MLPESQYRRHRVRAWDYGVALLLIGAHLALLMATMDIGFTRDEGFYFRAGEEYNGWFEELDSNRAAGRAEESFTREGIDRHWSGNPEHPVLMKTLFGLSWDLFSQESDTMSGATAFRFPTAIFAALLSGLLFLFVIEAFGSRLAALFAVGALLFMPRYFFHSHLACFDAPMSTVWFAVIFAYWKSFYSRTWSVLAGVLFGVALITKLNAFFIPFALVGHWAIAGWRDFATEGKGVARRFRLPRIPAAFFWMATLGPLIFYLGWPRHWYDTFQRITWYFARHLQHEHYYVQYFGEALVRPPFTVWFPVVMTLVTVPVITLLASAMGAGKVARDALAGRRGTGDAKRDLRGTGTLIAINIIWPMLIISRPDTPVFGGTKHWMQAMPFLAALAGVGVVAAFDTLWRRDSRRKLARTAAAGTFALLLLAPAVHATLAVHPHGTAYYNSLIGGVRGAADARMMRQFWGYSNRDGLEYLNEVAPENARIYSHNANGDAMRQYRRDGLMREDIREWGDMNRVDYLMYNHQRAFLSVPGPPGSLRSIWEAAQTTNPARVWSVDGVPVFSLYARPDHW